jgi:hypothetical protein
METSKKLKLGDLAEQITRRWKRRTAGELQSESGGFVERIGTLWKRPTKPPQARGALGAAIARLKGKK